jgi:hypothetical protein
MRLLFGFAIGRLLGFGVAVGVFTDSGFAAVSAVSGSFLAPFSFSDSALLFDWVGFSSDLTLAFSSDLTLPFSSVFFSVLIEGVVAAFAGLLIDTAESFAVVKEVADLSEVDWVGFSSDLALTISSDLTLPFSSVFFSVEGVLATLDGFAVVDVGEGFVVAEVLGLAVVGVVSFAFEAAGFDAVVLALTVEMFAFAGEEGVDDLFETTGIGLCIVNGLGLGFCSGLLSMEVTRSINTS